MQSRSVYSVQVVVISFYLFMVSLLAVANDGVANLLLTEFPEAFPNYILPSAFFVIFLLGLLSVRNALTQKPSNWFSVDASL